MPIESDEQVLWQETMHPGIFVWPILAFAACLALSAPLILLMSVFGRASGRDMGDFTLVVLLLNVLFGLLMFLAVFLARRNTKITLTNKRLLYRTGILARKAGEIPLENVEGIFISEPFLGRLFGYGTVAVTTLGGQRYILARLPRPQTFLDLLQKAVANAKATGSPSPKAVPPPQDDSRYMPRSAVASSGGHTPREPQQNSPFARQLSPEINPLKPQPLSSGQSLFWVMSASFAVVATIVLLVIFLLPGKSPPRSGSQSGPSSPLDSLSLSTGFPLPLAAPLLLDSPSLAQIKIAAERGDVEAQDKAAAQGSLNSQYQLAHLLMSWANSPMATSEARAAHSDEAIPWLIKAANRGARQAQVELGSVYSEGKYVSRDLPEAYKWFCLAADGNVFEFAANLGRTYRDATVLQMTPDQIAQGNARVAAFAPNSGDAVNLPDPAFVKQIRLSGLSGVPPRRLALINGKTLAAGESVTLKIDARAVTLHCLATKDNSAIIAIDGVTGTREFHLP